MGLNNLQSLFRHLQRQPGWEALRRYQQVQVAWQRILDPRLLKLTQPLGIQRGVLTIAVMSPALAQNLQLQRVSLLKQLNEALGQEFGEPLTDLRFSALHWHQRRPPQPIQSVSNTPQRLKPDVHPSPPQAPPKNVNEALTRWLHTLERRSPLLAECPQCQSPVSGEELERWSVCRACARLRWQQPLAQARPEVNNGEKTYGFPNATPPE
ncbi:MAG: DciA family protein [Synechocystis sp.]|nr:DciA family protein [Synechocystis sp.]